MIPPSSKAHGHHKSSDPLSRVIATACDQAGIIVSRFSDQDYATLPPFNWDVTDHEECAALHVIGQAVSILHVAAVFDDGQLVYRAKSLVPAPTSIVESPDYELGEAFSMSFGVDAGNRWKSDCATGLGDFIGHVLSKDSPLPVTCWRPVTAT